MMPHLLLFSLRIFSERLPKVVLAQGEEIRVADTPHIGSPPVARLVARYVENAHLDTIGKYIRSNKICEIFCLFF